MLPQTYKACLKYCTPIIHGTSLEDYSTVSSPVVKSLQNKNSMKCFKVFKLLKLAFINTFTSCQLNLLKGPMLIVFKFFHM